MVRVEPVIQPASVGGKQDDAAADLVGLTEAPHRTRPMIDSITSSDTAGRRHPRAIARLDGIHGDALPRAPQCRAPW